MLKPVIAAVLIAASGAVLAQAPAADAKEERRQKVREATKKAQEACASRPEAERRDCTRLEMCKQAKDPGKCEERAKARIEKRKQRQEKNKQ